MIDTKSLLTKRQAAAHLEVTERTLDRYRFRVANPLPFIALSKRNIRFRIEDIDRWLERNRVGEVS